MIIDTHAENEADEVSSSFTYAYSYTYTDNNSL